MSVIFPLRIVDDVAADTPLIMFSSVHYTLDPRRCPKTDGGRPSPKPSVSNAHLLALMAGLTLK